MQQGFDLVNSCYADPENRSRLNPAGGLRPALIEPRGSAACSTMQHEAKPKTGHSIPDSKQNLGALPTGRTAPVRFKLPSGPGSDQGLVAPALIGGTHLVL